MGAAYHPPRLLYLAGVLALCLTAPARLEFLEWEGESWHTLPFSTSSVTDESAPAKSPTPDAAALHIVLTDGHLKILRAAHVEWLSPPTWTVADASVTDLNHDGQEEVALVVWRAFEPWPIDRYLPFPGRISDFHDAQGRSCHLILIGERHGHFDELWAGSALADPLLQITAADLDGDGGQSLIALEGRYDHPFRLEAALTTWEWNGFGFSIRQRGPIGHGMHMVLLDEEAPVRILLQGHIRR